MGVLELIHMPSHMHRKHVRVHAVRGGFVAVHLGVCVYKWGLLSLYPRIHVENGPCAWHSAGCPGLHRTEEDIPSPTHALLELTLRRGRVGSRTDRQNRLHVFESRTSSTRGIKWKGMEGDGEEDHCRIVREGILEAVAQS